MVLLSCATADGAAKTAGNSAPATPSTSRSEIANQHVQQRDISISDCINTET
jgi:hypothetical protein